MKTSAAALGILALVSANLTSAEPTNLERLVRDAVSPEARVASSARQGLRAMGPSGLAALVTLNEARVNVLREGKAFNAEDLRLRAALDTVAGQRDAAFSGLYWYTSLEEARAAAARDGRPILSLRLLGKLDEELSCANSRFFRTALYANESISRLLREGWVLHWESVRPAPRITIDFGDGRRIERTITGNSLHYVLASDGRVVDVLPGLYGPGAFLFELEEVGPLARRVSGLAPDRFRAALRSHHEARLAEVTSVSEQSLDASSRRLMRSKLGPGTSDEAFKKMLTGFEASLRDDTLHNESTFRRTLHEWLSKGDTPVLAALTNRIYDELFLTPRTDPFLGLVPPDTYAAIEGDGWTKTTGTTFVAASSAAPLALSKMMVEGPAVRALKARPTGSSAGADAPRAASRR